MRKPRYAIAAATAAVVLVGSAGLAAAADTRKAVELPAQLRTDSAAEGLAAASTVGENTIRLWGNDRYETSAEISRNSWAPEMTAVVYLASGETFPDALSAGPSTLMGGPLLLTARDHLPGPIQQELARLHPCAVVVVGGPNAVSDAVARQADSYADPQSCMPF